MEHTTTVVHHSYALSPALAILVSLICFGILGIFAVLLWRTIQPRMSKPDLTGPITLNPRCKDEVGTGRPSYVVRNAMPTRPRPVPPCPPVVTHHDQ